MKNTLKNLNSNLFIDTSDTELFKFSQEVFTIGEKYPEIYRMIKDDLLALSSVLYYSEERIFND